MRGTVLVVDDDDSIVELITMALEDAGYQVVSAMGAAAVQAASTHQPGVILLDLMMPDVDGIEISRRLRREPTTAAIPIVIMSATTRMASLESSMRIDGRLPKPFDIRSLFATVAHWTESRGRDQGQGQSRNTA